MRHRPLAALALFLLAVFQVNRAKAATSGDLGPPFRSQLRPWIGEPEAPIFVIAIEAFSCTHCRAFHERSLPEFKRKYIDTGMVRWTAIPILSTEPVSPALGYASHYPVSFSPSDPSTRALAIARWAVNSGRFWEMESYLFFNPPFHLDEFDALLVKSRLISIQDLRQATSPNSSYFEEVNDDLKDCFAAHISHTPTFLFRKHRANTTLVEMRVEGYQSMDYFDKVVTQLINAK